MSSSQTPAFLQEREKARLRPGAYYRYCNHCGGEFKSPWDYLRHCEAQALGMGHGRPGTACPDITVCPWVRWNVAPAEWEYVYRAPTVWPPE